MTSKFSKDQSSAAADDQSPSSTESVGYFMEDEEEAIRLDRKTDRDQVRRHAKWAGLSPGMEVADLGCGSGKATEVLHSLVQPGGRVLGLDMAADRVKFAAEHYGREGLEFRQADIRRPLDEFGLFDFVWVRFVLEYYRRESADIVRSISSIIKPGGILCLVDLDNNCLCHYDMPPRLEKTLNAIIGELQSKANFDPIVGRKLYSYLYDLGFTDLAVKVEGHHVTYGDLRDEDAFNWLKKMEVAPKKIGYDFPQYDGGYEEFLEECKSYFNDRRRFTYSPLMVGVGKKPL